VKRRKRKGKKRKTVFNFCWIGLIVSAGGGQREHRTLTQTRSGGVIKTGANRRQHKSGSSWVTRFSILDVPEWISPLAALVVRPTEFILIQI
jgi:hypothetical protein